MSCYVVLIGGLGNQMFQIAAAYAYCKRQGLSLVIAPTTGGIPKRPEYWTTFLANCKRYIGSPSPGSFWCEPSFSYTEIPRGAAALQGYFQSSRYFADSVADIRELFTPAKAIQTTVKSRYSHLLEKPYVVMHVRRGDYFVNGNQHHGILTSAYYKRAMALFPESSFLVVSDDPTWCRAQPWLSGTTVLEELDECVTLWLMTQFCEFILSNSSFSWWAAWLSASTKVIVPATWFGPGGPTRWEDVYEADWIRLPIHE